jgi:phenylalanyl-tRNA synthetase beta chain
MGFQEIMRPVLSSTDMQFNLMNHKKGPAVEISNPISSEYACARCWLMPSSMEFLKANTNQEHPQRIFEIGDAVVVDESEETCTKTLRKLSMTVSDSGTGFFEIKGVFESLMACMNVPYELRTSDDASFIRGRAAEVLVKGKGVGLFGELHPQVLENWGLAIPTVSLELNIEAL